MERDDLPDRLQALEGQVSVLMNKHTAMESQIHEFSGHHTQQLNSMQAQLNSQGQMLHGHIESQNHSIQALFEQQMSQIRNLLAKRPRDDLE